MLEDSLLAIKEGNIEILEQGEHLLRVISNDQYLFRPEAYMSSSIGEHIRHVLDLFNAVYTGSNSNIVDYDTRTRGSSLESSRLEALSVIADLKSWLEKLSQEDIASELTVRSEVSLSTCRSIECQSSLARELVFAGTHMLHHFALIKVLASLQGIELGRGFGIAPATATFLRKNPKCAP